MNKVSSGLLCSSSKCPHLGPISLLFKMQFKMIYNFKIFNNYENQENLI